MVSAAEGLRKKGRHRASILIGPSNHQLGMARMFAAAVGGLIRIEIVRSKDEAEDLDTRLLSESPDR